MTYSFAVKLCKRMKWVPNCIRSSEKLKTPFFIKSPTEYTAVLIRSLQHLLWMNKVKIKVKKIIISEVLLAKVCGAVQDETHSGVCKVKLFFEMHIILSTYFHRFKVYRVVFSILVSSIRYIRYNYK